jgi:type III pantothenate kinase
MEDTPGASIESAGGLILAIDVGNSFLKLGLFKNSRLVQKWRIPSTNTGVVDCARVMEQIQSELPVVVIGSVVPALTEVICDRVRALRIEPLQIKSSMSLPFKNGYADQASLGVDRIASIAGALTLLPAPFIVIDIGTAVTVNVLDRTRNFRGGAIWAGPGLVAGALAAKTSKLPLLEPRPARSAIANNTEDGLLAGMTFGLAGGIEKLVQQSWEELGYKTAVLATGGGMELIRGNCLVIDRFEPDLTLLGLRSIYDNTICKKS